MFNTLIDMIDKVYEVIGRTKPMTECERIEYQTKLEAKLHADMQDAINRAPTENIRNQLIYRLNNNNYEYRDLVP